MYPTAPARRVRVKIIVMLC